MSRYGTLAGYEDARTRVAGGGRRTRTEDRYRIRSGGEFFQVPYVRHSRGAPECQEPVPQQRTGQETDQRRYPESAGGQRPDLGGFGSVRTQRAIYAGGGAKNGSGQVS